MTYIEYKHKIEFSEEQIGELMKFADLIGIKLFASTWDKDSVDVMSKYTKIGKLEVLLLMILNYVNMLERNLIF